VGMGFHPDTGHMPVITGSDMHLIQGSGPGQIIIDDWWVIGYDQVSEELSQRVILVAGR
jgi:hypothetical protein